MVENRWDLILDTKLLFMEVHWSELEEASDNIKLTRKIISGKYSSYSKMVPGHGKSVENRRQNVRLRFLLSSAMKARLLLE